MNFCSDCGLPVTLKIPEGDHLPRFVCSGCHTVHYQNPRLITGTLPIAPDGTILLCKRNIEPRKNFWTLPAGFMENGETTVQGALRETLEESNVKGKNPELISIISLPAWNQVHLFYRVDMPDYSYSSTPESIEVKLFSEYEVPWDELAFKTVEMTLKHHFSHQRKTERVVLNDHVHWPEGE